MDNLVTFESHGDIGVIVIDNPPVNVLSMAVSNALHRALDQFDAAGDLRALVICAAGRTFVAGANISEFEQPDYQVTPFKNAMNRIENLDRPVVAALHGASLGGGLELALACHYRIAAPATKVGLPEVLLGVLPGSGGTQRLPRLVGPVLALDMMLSGRRVDALSARDAGLIDVVSDGDPREAGLSYARSLLDSGARIRRSRDLSVDMTGVPVDFFQTAMSAAMTRKGTYPAPHRIVRCVEASVRMPFDEGLALEERLFQEARRSPKSAAMRHLFFAERAAVKIPGLCHDVALRSIRSVGVVGAGTMGGGIAMNFANGGFRVVVVEANAEALARGLSVVRKNYETSAKSGRLTEVQVEQRMSLLEGKINDAALADCDLVIEAVFENMNLKRQVCARLGELCKPGAIIASNTSTLDVNALAGASGRPRDVLGMHFFSPANVMRLLEVVRGAKTAPDVLATVMQLARTIGKTPVVSGVCYGFIGNRMLESYLRESEFLMMEGASPAQIDSAIEALGFSMGPCRMMDLAGLDVGAKVVLEQASVGTLPADPSYRAPCRKMFELGRFGQKAGAGYYRYDGRKPVPDSETEQICRDVAYAHGIARRNVITDDEIVERCLYPLINEGARILDEGIAYRPGDIDVVWARGYAFPDHRGGPMFLADQIGLSKIVDGLAQYAKERGNTFGYWTASGLLTKLASEGRRISDWSK